jgi:hypothetical protein
VHPRLLAAAHSAEVQVTVSTAYGRKYIARAILNGPGGVAAKVVTVWIVKTGGRGSAVDHRLPGEEKMNYKLMDSVVLVRDLPEHGLRKGDLGAVVELYEPDGMEVEFVRVSGKTQATVTLLCDDVRRIAAEDQLAVRRVKRTA